MKFKGICKKILLHGTAAVMGMSVMLGAFGALGVTNHEMSADIVASAADAPKSGKGTFRSGGHTYTYEYNTSDKGVETFTLKSVKVGNRNVSIPSRVYADGSYHTVNALGSNFGEYISAETVTIPNSVTHIGNNVFQSCKVGTLYVSSNVKEIGGYFCSSSPQLGNVVYNGTQLESLGSGAFSGIFIRDVYGIKPNSKGAYIFGDWLIRYTGGKSAVYIHDIGNYKIKKLGPDCFDTGNGELNRKLTSVDLYGVTTISDRAFNSNTNLEAVSCSNSVNKVYGQCAFTDTKWYQNKIKNNVCMIGSVLLYYHTDGTVIDLSGYDFRNVKNVAYGAINNCGKATTLKLRSSVEHFDDTSFVGSGSGAKNINTVYVDGRKIVYDDNAQFLPKVIANNYETFKNSPYVKKFKVDKTKGIFKLMGITYYGENGKGGVSGLSNNQKYQIAFKLHEYIATNYFYDFDTKDCFQPFLDGKSGFVCEQYAELYAYLLESAGVNAEVVDSCILDENGKEIYNGKHAWNIVEIGGKWYHCDVCWDSGRYNYGDANSMYWFMVSDDFMKKEGGAHGMWHFSTLVKDEFYSTQSILPKCNIMLGDAHGNLERTQADVDLIQRYLLRYSDAVKSIKLANCDTNFSGGIDMGDVLTTKNLIPRRSVDPLKGYANHTVTRQ